VKLKSFPKKISNKYLDRLIASSKSLKTGEVEIEVEITNRVEFIYFTFTLCHLACWPLQTAYTITMSIAQMRTLRWTWSTSIKVGVCLQKKIPECIHAWVFTKTFHLVPCTYLLFCSFTGIVFHLPYNLFNGFNFSLSACQTLLF